MHSDVTADELSRRLVACARLDYEPRFTQLDYDEQLASDTHVVARRRTFEFTTVAMAHIYCQCKGLRLAESNSGSSDENQLIPITVPLLPETGAVMDYQVHVPKAHVTISTALRWVSSRVVRVR